MREIKSPNPLTWVAAETAVFLGGSIEMGTAEDWQLALAQRLTASDLVLLNPRREAWDATWVQSIDNPVFKEQVNWELSALESADLVVFYFAPGTKSPITLMELGIVANERRNRHRRIIVCCPDGYWRKGNIEVVCDRYSLELVHTFDELVTAIKLGN